MCSFASTSSSSSLGTPIEVFALVKNGNKWVGVYEGEFSFFQRVFVFSERRWNRRRKGKCLSEFSGGMLSFLVHFGQRLCFTVLFLLDTYKVKATYSEWHIKNCSFHCDFLGISQLPNRAYLGWCQLLSIWWNNLMI